MYSLRLGLIVTLAAALLAAPSKWGEIISGVGAAHAPRSARTKTPPSAPLRPAIAVPPRKTFAQLLSEQRSQELKIARQIEQRQLLQMKALETQRQRAIEKYSKETGRHLRHAEP
jgi:hypothetical protein